MRKLVDVLRQVLPRTEFPLSMSCANGTRVFHTIDEFLSFIESADAQTHTGISAVEYNEMLRDLYVKHGVI